MYNGDIPSGIAYTIDRIVALEGSRGKNHGDSCPLSYSFRFQTNFRVIAENQVNLIFDELFKNLLFFFGLEIGRLQVIDNILKF
jgi:hypothetical protein